MSRMPSQKTGAHAKPPTPKKISSADLVPERWMQYPHFDPECMDTIVLGRWDIFQQLQQIFVQDTTERLHFLEQLLAENCLQEAENTQIVGLLHTLKGEAQHVAALRFAALSKRLEFAARERNLSLIKEEFPRLQEAFQALKADWDTL